MPTLGDATEAHLPNGRSKNAHLLFSEDALAPGAPGGGQERATSRISRKPSTERVRSAIRGDIYLRRFIGLLIAAGEPEAQAIERRVTEAARAFAADYRGRG